jgi:hypothetical protein
MAPLNNVEGHVGGFPRGGSSPLGRMRIWGVKVKARLALTKEEGGFTSGLGTDSWCSPAARLG